MKSGDTIRVTDPRDRSGFRARVVRARRAVECSWCSHVIAAGEFYGRTRDFHSSRSWDYRVCGAHVTEGT